jgi:hypothetical protein
MSVKLQFAYNSSDSLISILDKLDRGKSYYCPFCKEVVIVKKGNTRSHHFAHKPNSNCSANEETIIHFEAKYYLKMMIKGNNADKINLSFSGDSFTLINFLSKELNLNSTMEITLQQITDYYSVEKLKTEVEYTLPTSAFIADVYCPVQSKQGMVLEVFVTHELELEKKAFMENNCFPYLELIPYYHNDNIEFNIHCYYLPGFFDYYKNRIGTAIKNYLYPLYENDLIQIAEKVTKPKKIIDYKIQAVHALIKDINSDKHSALYSNILQALDEHSNKTRVVSYMASVKREEPLKDIQYIRTKDNRKALMANEKRYFVSSEQNILYEIIHKLLHQIEINALIGHRSGNSSDSIVGFDLLIPEQNKLNEIVKQSVIKTLQEYIYKFELKKLEIDRL